MDRYSSLPVRSISKWEKYTITVRPLPEEADAEQDPAFDIASLAVTTNIPDLSSEHYHYLHGMPKREAHER